MWPSLSMMGQGRRSIITDDALDCSSFCFSRYNARALLLVIAYIETAPCRSILNEGYLGYEKLLLKPSDVKVSGIEFKSGERKKLVEAGYVIVGNIGDQWTDILGAPEGARTFKLPDPMYYVG